MVIAGAKLSVKAKLHATLEVITRPSEIVGTKSLTTSTKTHKNEESRDPTRSQDPTRLRDPRDREY